MAPLSYLYRGAVALLLVAACSCMTLEWGMSDPVNYIKTECFWSKSGWLKIHNNEFDRNTNLMLTFSVNDLRLCGLDLKSCRPTIGSDVCSCTTETGNGELIKRFTVKTRPSAEDSGASLTVHVEEISTKSPSKAKVVTTRKLATLPNMREFVDPRPRCFFRGAKETPMEHLGFLHMTHPAGQLSTLQCCALGAMKPVVTKATFNGETIHSDGKCLVADVTGRSRNSKLRFYYKEHGGCQREGTVEYGFVAIAPRRRSQRDTKVGPGRISNAKDGEENNMKGFVAIAPKRRSQRDTKVDPARISNAKDEEENNMKGTKDLIPGLEIKQCHEWVDLKKTHKWCHNETKKRCFAKTQLCDGYINCPNYETDEENCEVCKNSAMKCGNVKQCVRPKVWCDGYNDCAYGTDETNCTKHGCKDGSMFCQDNKQCIRKTMRCDGFIDCQDQSDETNCETWTCVTKHRKCYDNKQCVLTTKFCDGRLNDCKDGLDEEDRVCNPMECTSNGLIPCFTNKECTMSHFFCVGAISSCYGYENFPKFCAAHTCSPGFQKCPDGKECILQYVICDGNTDCRDSSDENKDFCNAYTCWPSHHKCSDNIQCVGKESFCDGYLNCKDGSDERDCMKCADNKGSFPKWSACDGNPLCADGSDENNCESCEEGAMRCASEKKCVSRNRLCDGHNDCSDRMDERDCVAHNCTTDYKKCANNLRCLHKSQFCNGRTECLDDSDEKNCESCYWPVFTCSDKIHPQCVAFEFRCDGKNDCHDSSDEEDCGHCREGAAKMCASEKKCVSLNNWCDGYNHCSDRTDEKDCDCFRGRGEHYMGRVNQAAGGLTCQRWDSQEPHEHDIGIYPHHFPDKRMPENYCRNPNPKGESRPWCYTTKPGSLYGICDIPECPDKESTGEKLQPSGILLFTIIMTHLIRNL